MRDQAHDLQIKRVLSPVSVADNTAQVGQIIDRLGYDALTYVIIDRQRSPTPMRRSRCCWKRATPRTWRARTPSPTPT